MKLSIKAFNDSKFDVEVDEGATVQQLKEVIATTNGAAVDQQRLIYTGRVLKDADLLSSYNIKDGHTVHMVKSNTATRPAAAAAAAAATTPVNPPAAATTAANPPPAANPFAGLFGMPTAPAGQANPQQAAANPFANPFAGFGGAGGGFGGMPPMDSQTLIQMLQNPYVQQTMTQMMADPQFVDTMLQQNPALQGMATPEMRAALSDPNYLRQMMNPQNVQLMLQMQTLLGQMQATQSGVNVNPNPWGAVPTAGVTPTPTTAPTTVPGSLPTPPAAQVPDINQLLQSLMAGGPVAPLGTGIRPTVPAAAVALPPPEVRFQVQLQQLQEMGFFDPTENINALLASGGNVNMAVERLLSAFR